MTESAADVFEISVVSYQGKPPASPISAPFGRDGGTIGRGPANTLVLADPNRFVSRLQAKVSFAAGHLTIANASAANPLLVNDRELEAGENARLADGDEIRIGLYLLRVRGPAPAASEDAERTQASHVWQPPPVATAPPPAPSTPARATPAAFSSPGAASAHLPASPMPVPAGAAGDAPSKPLVAPASLGPLDPLQLSFGESSADPFADLLPNAAPPVDASRQRTPTVHTASVDRSAVALPRAPAIAHEPSAAPPRQGADADPFASLAPPPHPSPAASQQAIVPDQVWDDLARFAPAEDAAALPPSPTLPANFDAFAQPSAAPRNTADPLAELAPNAVTLDSFDKLDAPIDNLFADAPGRNALVDDIIPDANAAVPDPLAGHDTVDPIAIFDEDEAKLRMAAEAAFKRSERDDVPELNAYFRPAEARFEQPVSPPPGDPLVTSFTEIVPAREHGPSTPAPIAAPAAAPTEAPAAQTDRRAEFARSHDAERMLCEFLAGAGIPNATIKEGLTPELMNRIGAMLATAVQGTIELIAARAMLKREVKADVTMIASTRNNPLKFLPDAESALLQMFGSRIPGFMAPVEAMDDAFRDLRAHEVGVIAGMHAALAQVLQRFAPDELARRLRPAGVLEGLLPNSHKARLWDTFAEMYVDISREAQDDFQSLFGKAFLQAYENEVSRLKGQ